MVVNMNNVITAAQARTNVHKFEDNKKSNTRNFWKEKIDPAISSSSENGFVSCKIELSIFPREDHDELNEIAKDLGFDIKFSSDKNIEFITVSWGSYLEQ